MGIEEEIIKTKPLAHRPRSVADFVGNYMPSDNIWAATSGIGDDIRPSLADLHYLMTQRVGICRRATWDVAGDIVRNKFKFTDEEEREIKPNDTTKAIFRFMVNTDLHNQLQQWVNYDRGYGIGYLIKYWTANDVKGNNMEEEPPKKPPRKFRALSPNYMTPDNLTQSGDLDYDQEVWTFSGGKLNTATKIHSKRIQVLITEPYENDWRGLSIFEPVWTPLISYFNSLISVMKGLRQWGEVVPALFAGLEDIPDEEVANKALDLMDLYEDNYKFFFGRETRLEFISTKIGQGISEAMEQFKEDICSGWVIPLNQLFGRSVGGGLAGAGAVVSKEDYLQMIGNNQMAITDDVLKIFIEAGFKIEGYGLAWNLAIKKTKQQELMEEGMELQNEILKLQLKQMKIQTRMLKAQEKMGVPQQPMGGEEIEKGEVEKPPAKQPKGIKAEAADFMSTYWRNIHIENHIQFPYDGKYGKYRSD